MTQYNKRPWIFGNLVPENFIDKLQANIIHRANKNLPKKKKSTKRTWRVQKHPHYKPDVEVVEHAEDREEMGEVRVRRKMEVLVKKRIIEM